jgi:hypothetical protein
MMRKYLFLGLTLVLIVALTNLIIRGCRLQKKQAQQLVETVEEAKPTATRVLEPQDLKIVLSKMVLETKKNEEGKQAHTARHEIEIYNSGNVSYKEIQLRLDYRDRSGKTIETRSHTVIQTVSPGVTLKLPNISIDKAPSSAMDPKIIIVSADIAPPIPPNK